MNAYATTPCIHAPQKKGVFSFGNQKIGAKISLGFCAVLSITLALSGLAHFSLGQIDTNVASFAHKVEVVTTTGAVERDFLWLRRLMREFGVTGDGRLLEDGRKQRQLVDDDIQAALGRIKNPERLARMKDANEKFAAYSEFFEKIATVRHDLDHETKDILDPLGLQMREDADKMQTWAVSKEGNGNISLISGDVMKHLLLMRLNANKTLAGRDQQTVERAEKYFGNLRASLAAFGAQTANEDMRRRANEVGALAKQYFDAFQTAARDMHALDELLNGSALKAGVDLTADLEAIKASGLAEEKQIENDTESLIAFSERLLLAVTAVGLLIGLALAWSIGRIIANPVKGMTDAMTALAAGHLDVEVPAQGNKDEIGEMASAVQVFKDAAVAKIRRDAEIEEERIRNQETQRRSEEETIRRERELVSTSIGAGLAKLASKDLTYRMTDEVPEAYRRLQTDFNSAIAQLESALAVVAGGAQAIGSGTSQIAVAADDLSRRTEQQAASLEETAAALEEITVTVKRSAEGAVHASDIVGTTKAEAEKSGAIVRQAVDAMGRIEKSSQEIGQIIGVIDEIAFQTNLLALNAGVEAARAGDAGKGFAVVASEVRALAQRSAEAAKEIKGLISASTSQVEQGVQLVDQTGKALEKIVAQVADIDKVVTDIACGAKEQATSLTEVNIAVGQMDQNTQKNAAMVEETTAASHNLRKETEELLRSVASFQIDQRRMGGGARAPAAKSTPRPALKTMAGARGGNAVRKADAEAARDGWEEF